GPLTLSADLHVDPCRVCIIDYRRIPKKTERETMIFVYSTVTDFARFLGWSTSHPLRTAMWYASSCSGMIESKGERRSLDGGISITRSDIFDDIESPSVTTEMTMPSRALTSTM